MQKPLLAAVVLLLLLTSVSAQEMCPDVPGKTSATLRFRRLGETVEIPLRDDQADRCEPVELELHWFNGRNNGSNFSVAFLDGNNRPIYAKQISAFMTGVLQFPVSLEPRAVYGSSMALVSVPTTVRIEAVSPFAGPVNLSFSLARIARAQNKETERGHSASSETDSNDENQIVSVHDAVRLIGATRLPLVQIELKTSRPFPVRDMPLQLQVGKKVFVDELSGDYTGRKLTLSLTPEMFAALNDGDEILAFYGKPSSSLTLAQKESSSGSTEDVWRFGKLLKSKKQPQ